MTTPTGDGTIDVEKARLDTPGCASVAHLNNAGAALPPAPVLDAVNGHLRLEAVTGGYEAADQARELTEGFYDAVAGLVGAHRDEIAYVENATRAWDMAFYAIPFAPGDRILTTTSEYASNAIAFHQVAKSRGVSVETLPDDGDGQLSLDALAAGLARGGVRLVAINHVPTHNGLVNPAAEVGRLCREAGVLFLLDACQSVGQLAVDVTEIGCDMLSATGRKFLRGPRGTGFLYVRHGLVGELEPPFLDLHSAEWTAPDRYEIRGDARRFETWERYVAGQIGLGVAAGYAAALGVAAIEERVTGLAARLRDELAATPGVTVLDRGARRCGIVTFTVAGHESAGVKGVLRERGINVSVTDRAHQRLDPNAVPAAVRASVHYYNTDEELDALVSAVRGLAARH
ncbi:aminotransferase class V-fold PLP-dependent enzyme [Streptosporangium sp. NPDC004379]|uniref:aminotransferase class V-fold PLP-dependent enzyme n=1 Tax=Streptosporangium sp. NPDC004379 TaxID=3366189 RepID=UPI0036AFD428